MKNDSENLTTILDLIKAKRDVITAKVQEEKTAAQLKREATERFFAPVRAVMDELLAADPPIMFCTTDYPNRREKPLRRSQFSTGEQAGFTPLLQGYKKELYEKHLSTTTSFDIRVSRGTSYSIGVRESPSGGLKFYTTRNHEYGQDDRKEFTTAQDAIDDLLDIIAEYSVTDDRPPREEKAEEPAILPVKPEPLSRKRAGGTK